MGRKRDNREKGKSLHQWHVISLFTAGITEESFQLESTPKSIAKVSYPGKKEVIASYSSRFFIEESTLDIRTVHALLSKSCLIYQN